MITPASRGFFIPVDYTSPSSNHPSPLLRYRSLILGILIKYVTCIDTIMIGSNNNPVKSWKNIRPILKTAMLLLLAVSLHTQSMLLIYLGEANVSSMTTGSAHHLDGSTSALGSAESDENCRDTNDAKHLIHHYSHCCGHAVALVQPILATSSVLPSMRLGTSLTYSWHAERRVAGQFRPPITG